MLPLLSWPEFVEALTLGRLEVARRYRQAEKTGDGEAAMAWASELRDWDKLLADCGNIRLQDDAAPCRADQTVGPDYVVPSPASRPAA